MNMDGMPPHHVVWMTMLFLNDTQNHSVLTS